MNVELLQPHWVNGRVFAPGTVLDLPEACAGNLIASGAARMLDAVPLDAGMLDAVHEPPPTDND